VRVTRAAPRMRRLLMAGIIALAALAAPADRGEAAIAGPAGTIESFYGTLLAVMKEGRHAPFNQRYTTLLPAITHDFNLPLMTRIAIGPDWTRLTSDQQQRLETAFARYTIATYTNRFDDYSGQRFVVDPNPAPNPNGVIVHTRLIPASGQPISLDYLMRRGAEGQWQVLDIYLNGTISELATRRAEFATVLSRDGPEGLVRVLDQRSAALRTG
jgi:phospholipid transport system substrate-binding protein